MAAWFVHEDFTDEERARLAPHFTNLDGPVFALTNLPEVVKGALFARYSRTPKSLRRLFLDEFAEPLEAGAVAGLEGVKVDKAEQLFDRVFFEFGDDSVAQLGGVHLACEQASQLLAKAIEWGRLAAYLEQSTRYMRYDDRPGGRWRLTTPPEIEGGPAGEAYEAYATRTFEAYGRMFQPLFDLFAERFPKDPNDSDFLYRSTITAKTCDTLRVLLPAGTRSNLGRVRDRSGVRADADPDARAPARGGPRLRRPDARRAPQGDPRVPQARRPPRPRRRLVPLPRGDARRHGRGHREVHRGRRARPPRHRDAHRLRPARRGEGHRRGDVRDVGPARRPAPVARPHDERRRTRRGAARLRRRARQPAAQARPRVRTHRLPLRRALRLRRVPRPPAPPPAHARVAAAVARARVRHAGGDRRRRDDRRVAPRDGGLGLDLGDALGAGRPRRRAVRGRDGLPDPVRDADERPGGDAPDRAPFVAAGPPDLPAGRAADARPDRHDRRPPRDRLDDERTSTRATSISNASRPSAAPRRSGRPRGRAEP